MYVYSISKYKFCSCSVRCAISMNMSVLENRRCGSWSGVAVGPGELLQSEAGRQPGPDNDKGAQCDGHVREGEGHGQHAGADDRVDEVDDAAGEGRLADCAGGFGGDAAAVLGGEGSMGSRPCGGVGAPWAGFMVAVGVALVRHDGTGGLVGGAPSVRSTCECCEEGINGVEEC